MEPLRLLAAGEEQALCQMACRRYPFMFMELNPNLGPQLHRFKVIHMDDFET
jgi:hypothetical protein